MVALRRVATLLLAAVVVLALAATASGAKRGGTKVTLTHPNNSRFAGRVKSNRKVCRTQRLVTLYYTDPFTGQRQPLSVQRTKGKGRYRVDLPQPAYGGRYQARVTKVTKRGRKVCRGGRSRVLTVIGVPPSP